MRLIAAVLAASLIMPGLAAAAPPPSGVLDFEVLRNGKPLGRHLVTFEQAGADLKVTVDVDLKVRVGPFTPFRYRHDIREVWRDGRLQLLEATALKDGEDLAVSAGYEDGVIAVRGRDFEGFAPAEIIPSSWWNPAVLRAEQALNTETGVLMPIAAESLGTETVALGDGTTVTAERFRLEAELTLDLWYDAGGRWVKCAFEARGSEIEYVLQAAPDAEPGA